MGGAPSGWGNENKAANKGEGISLGEAIRLKGLLEFRQFCGGRILRTQTEEPLQDARSIGYSALFW